MTAYIVPSHFPDGPDNAPADCGPNDTATAYIIYDNADPHDTRIIAIFDTLEIATKALEAVNGNFIIH